MSGEAQLALQVLAEHAVPFPQTAPALPPPLPQLPVAPQFVALVVGSTQVPLQLISVPGHETWHELAVQTLPLAHAVPALPPPMPQSPEAPQCVRLVVGSMQIPPQLISVPGHDTWHEPLAQTVPAPQMAPTVPPPLPQSPEAPQLERLVDGSTQVPPQLIWLPGHDTWQEPLLHTFPFVQAAPALPPPLPHSPVAPQNERLLSGSTQVPPQLIWVPGQATAQMPLPHTFPAAQAVPTLPPPLPHEPLAPQLLRLVRGSMQTPPQLICEPGQET
jgi:hypothetical protein